MLSIIRRQGLRAAMGSLSLAAARTALPGMWGSSCLVNSTNSLSFSRKNIAGALGVHMFISTDIFRSHFSE